MRNRRETIRVAILVLAALLLAGCSPPERGRFGMIPDSGEPTMTAILLPTQAATDTEAADLGRIQPEPVDTEESTSAPEPTATPLAKPSPLATAAPPTPFPSPTPEAESPTPEPAKRPATSKPTAAPELTGRLVFQTAVGGDFYVIDVGGDTPGSPGPRRITDGIDPIWSPDGQQIAFTRWREPRGVWIVSVSSDVKDLVTSERRVFDWNEARWPSWSPDGQQLLFTRQYGGTEEKETCVQNWCFTVPPKLYWKLGMVNARDGAFAEPPGPEIAQAPTWSPDGEWIVYAGEKGLVVQDLTGERLTQITDATRDTGPAWSPDGKQVAFTRSQHDHWEVYVLSFPDGPYGGGGSLTRLTETPDRPDGQPGSSAAPAWSPDGKYLAFLTDRSGKWEIWVAAAPGSASAGVGGPRPMFTSELEGLTVEYSYGGERALSWTQ